MRKLYTTIALITLLSTNTFSAKYITSTINFRSIGYEWSGISEHHYNVELSSEKLILDNEKYYLVEIEKIDYGSFTVWFGQGYNADRGCSKIEIWCYPKGKRILYIKYPNIEYQYEMLKVNNY